MTAAARVDDPRLKAADEWLADVATYAKAVAGVRVSLGQPLDIPEKSRVFLYLYGRLEPRGQGFGCRKNRLAWVTKSITLNPP